MVLEFNLCCLNNNIKKNIKGEIIIINFNIRNKVNTIIKIIRKNLLNKKRMKKTFYKSKKSIKIILKNQI